MYLVDTGNGGTRTTDGYGDEMAMIDPPIALAMFLNTYVMAVIVCWIISSLIGQLLSTYVMAMIARTINGEPNVNSSPSISDTMFETTLPIIMLPPIRIRSIRYCSILALELKLLLDP